MQNKIVITAGYSGTGSSAATDLLSEIEDYDINNGDFEYVFMHCPNGVFDFEDKVLSGNNMIRSDEAIHSFLSCMKDLYDKKDFWISGYKDNISVDFLKYCEEFIEDLNPIKIKDTYWYYQENPINFRMKSKYLYKKIVEKLMLHKVRIQKPLIYKDVSFVYPTEEEYYGAAKKFLEKIFNSLGLQNHNLVLDQFILPQNLYRLNRYMDGDYKVIVVDRDPRDLFIVNKYYWTKTHLIVPYANDVRDYCKQYRLVRERQKLYDDAHILRINFEDLIYRYEETVKKVYEHLGVTEEQHIRKRQVFNPDISINNTQLFLNEEYRLDDIKVIERELKEYLYPFTEKKVQIQHEVF